MRFAEDLLMRDGLMVSERSLRYLRALCEAIVRKYFEKPWIFGDVPRELNERLPCECLAGFQVLLFSFSQCCSFRFAPSLARFAQSYAEASRGARG
jgi:hypothetical protein